MSTDMPDGWVCTCGSGTAYHTFACLWTDTLGGVAALVANRASVEADPSRGAPSPRPEGNGWKARAEAAEKTLGEDRERMYQLHGSLNQKRVDAERERDDAREMHRRLLAASTQRINNLERALHKAWEALAVLNPPIITTPRADAGAIQSAAPTPPRPEVAIRERIAYVIQLWRDRSEYRSRSATREDFTKSVTWMTAANELEHAMMTIAPAEATNDNDKGEQG